MTRIAIGQLLQETNSLNPVLTRREDFESYGLVSGAAVVERYGDVGELAGFTTFSEAAGTAVEWHGMLRAVAWSGGPLEQGLLAELIECMVAPLRGASIDGVLLSLHGAQCAIGEPDVSGRMLEAIRTTIGSQVPIVATLDLHANVSEPMRCWDTTLFRTSITSPVAVALHAAWPVYSVTAPDRRSMPTRSPWSSTVRGGQPTMECRPISGDDSWRRKIAPMCTPPASSWYNRGSMRPGSVGPSTRHIRVTGRPSTRLSSAKPAGRAAATGTLSTSRRTP